MDPLAKPLALWKIVALPYRNGAGMLLRLNMPRRLNWISRTDWNWSLVEPKAAPKVNAKNAVRRSIRLLLGLEYLQNGSQDGNPG
jgi:hypothetical protein